MSMILDKNKTCAVIGYFGDELEETEEKELLAVLEYLTEVKGVVNFLFIRPSAVYERRIAGAYLLPSIFKHPEIKRLTLRKKDNADYERYVENGIFDGFLPIEELFSEEIGSNKDKYKHILDLSEYMLFYFDDDVGVGKIVKDDLYFAVEYARRNEKKVFSFCE